MQTEKWKLLLLKWARSTAVGPYHTSRPQGAGRCLWPFQRVACLWGPCQYTILPLKCHMVGWVEQASFHPSQELFVNKVMSKSSAWAPWSHSREGLSFPDPPFTSAQEPWDTKLEMKHRELPPTKPRASSVDFIDGHALSLQGEMLTRWVSNYQRN